VGILRPEQENYDIAQYLDEYARECPDKEIRIINAAINTFSEKGFYNAKTREIAQRAGIAEGTIFRYFPSKDAILEKMVPLLIKVMQPRLEKPLKQIIEEKKDEPIEAVLAAILEDRLSIIRGNRKFLMSVLPELIHRPALAQQLRDSIVPVIEMYVALVLDEAKKRGEIRGDVRADIATAQLLGFVITYSLLHGEKTENELRTDVAEFLRCTTKGWGRNVQN
jgi:AcrR family transcriptional regulator